MNLLAKMAFVMSTLSISGCISQVLTSADLVYDRHNVYLKFEDFQLGADASRALYKDLVFKQKGCYIDLAIFNQDILLAGHVPSIALRDEAVARLSQFPSKRRLFNQLAISSSQGNPVQDAWITGKIRSFIVAHADIDPKAFKVITADRIVYIMGDVEAKQAEQVIQFARGCVGVKRVVKLLKYYYLTDHPK